MDELLELHEHPQTQSLLLPLMIPDYVYLIVFLVMAVSLRIAVSFPLL
jgi:hypothetical protein